MLVTVVICVRESLAKRLIVEAPRPKQPKILTSEEYGHPTKYAVMEAENDRFSHTGLGLGHLVVRADILSTTQDAEDAKGSDDAPCDWYFLRAY